MLPKLFGWDENVNNLIFLTCISWLVCAATRTVITLTRRLWSAVDTRCAGSLSATFFLSLVFYFSVVALQFKISVSGLQLPITAMSVALSLACAPRCTVRIIVNTFAFVSVVLGSTVMVAAPRLFPQSSIDQQLGSVLTSQFSGHVLFVPPEVTTVTRPIAIFHDDVGLTSPNHHAFTSTSIISLASYAKLDSLNVTLMRGAHIILHGADNVIQSSQITCLTLPCIRVRSSGFEAPFPLLNVTLVSIEPTQRMHIVAGSTSTLCMDNPFVACGADHSLFIGEEVWDQRPLGLIVAMLLPAIVKSVGDAGSMLLWDAILPCSAQSWQVIVACVSSVYPYISIAVEHIYATALGFICGAFHSQQLGVCNMPLPYVHASSAIGAFGVAGTISREIEIFFSEVGLGVVRRLFWSCLVLECNIVLHIARFTWLAVKCGWWAAAPAARAALDVAWLLLQCTRWCALVDFHAALLLMNPCVQLIALLILAAWQWFLYAMGLTSILWVMYYGETSLAVHATIVMLQTVVVAIALWSEFKRMIAQRRAGQWFGLRSIYAVGIVVQNHAKPCVVYGVSHLVCFVLIVGFSMLPFVGERVRSVAQQIVLPLASSYSYTLFFDADPSRQRVLWSFSAKVALAVALQRTVGNLLNAVLRELLTTGALALASVGFLFAVRRRHSAAIVSG